MSIYRLSGTVSRQELDQFLYNSALSDCDQGFIKQSNLADGNADQFSTVDFAKLPKELQAKLFGEYKRFQTILSPNIQIDQTAKEKPSFLEIAGALVLGIVTAPFALFGAGCNCDPRLQSVKRPEVCDGQDNDLDGEIDEGVLNACGKCGPVPEEVCDGIDNNCDGKTDENLKRACYSGPANTQNFGECKEGKQTCLNGVFGACEGEVIPSAEEICDAKDNDCDGTTDNGVTNFCGGGCSEPCARISVHSYENESSLYPSLAWSGSEYGVAWGATETMVDETRFALIGADGTKKSNDVKLSGYSQPSLTWGNEIFAMTWGSSALYFSRFGHDGRKIGDDVKVVDDYYASRSSIVWTDSVFGIAWPDDQIQRLNPRPYFSRLDSNGNKIGQVTKISDDVAEKISLTWTGNEFGIAWSTSLYVTFARLDSEGHKIGSDIPIYGPPPPSYTIECHGMSTPSLVWAKESNEYGLAWSCEDFNNYQQKVYFLLMDSNGNQLGNKIRIDDAYESHTSPISLAWNGTEFGIAWIQETPSGQNNLAFARISAAGYKIDGSKEVYPGHSGSMTYGLSLVWGANQYGLAWDRTNYHPGYPGSHFNSEIYFTQISVDQ